MKMSAFITGNQLVFSEYLVYIKLDRGFHHLDSTNLLYCFNLSNGPNAFMGAKRLPGKTQPEAWLI
jgi:hypothetical protein